MRGFGRLGTDGPIDNVKISDGSFNCVVSGKETDNGLQTTNTGINYPYSSEGEGMTGCRILINR